MFTFALSSLLGTRTKSQVHFRRYFVGCYSPSAPLLIRAQTGHGRRKNVDGGAGGGY